MIERRFQGMAMEAAVVAVYERKKANVAELEKRLGKTKGASE
jgi:hypothetical protein